MSAGRTVSLATLARQSLLQIAGRPAAVEAVRLVGINPMADDEASASSLGVITVRIGQRLRDHYGSGDGFTKSSSWPRLSTKGMPAWLFAYSGLR